MNVGSVFNRANLALALLVALVVALDVLLFNAYPFLCGKPWSHSLLLSSLKGLRTYVVCACIHYIVLDAGLIAVPILYLWLCRFRPSARRLWAPILLLASLIVLDVSTVLLVDYFMLLSSVSYHSSLGSRELSMLVLIVSNLDTALRFWVAPLVLPIVVVYSTTRASVMRLVSAALGKVVVACICSFAVSQLLATLLELFINAAIARYSPLAMFTYFRCVSPQVAEYIEMDFELKTPFIPVLQTWGGVARVAVTLVVEALLCRWLASSVRRLGL